MRSFLFGFLLFFLWAAFSRYYYVCVIKKHCEPNPPPTEQVEQPRENTLAFKAQDSILLEHYEQFSFEAKSILPDVSENNKVFLDSVAAYLQANPSQSITITGFYGPGEKEIESGYYENLGVARAAAIRSILISKGIDESRFFLNSAMTESDNYAEPLTFNASGASDSNNDEETGQFVKEQFSFYNMSFSDANFEYNSYDFKPGNAFILYADSVISYLELNPEKQLTIIGHTDSDGTEARNEELGMERAKAVRAYFTEKGLEAEIKVGSKGKRTPVVPNTSPENKQKNRRVNLIIE